MYEALRIASERNPDRAQVEDTERSGGKSLTLQWEFICLNQLGELHVKLERSKGRAESPLFAALGDLVLVNFSRKTLY